MYASIFQEAVLEHFNGDVLVREGFITFIIHIIYVEERLWRFFFGGGGHDFSC